VSTSSRRALIGKKVLGPAEGRKCEREHDRRDNGATALLLPAQKTRSMRALAALRMVWASAAWMAVEMLCVFI